MLSRIGQCLPAQWMRPLLSTTPLLYTSQQGTLSDAFVASHLPESKDYVLPLSNTEVANKQVLRNHRCLPSRKNHIGSHWIFMICLRATNSKIHIGSDHACH